MSPIRKETARDWLEDQLRQLAQLRNANPRDSQFREWRQNTLTFVQRIWVGDSPRAKRFRRVPFSPPSTLADPRQNREAFERGCAEVAQLLKEWIEDLDRDGIAPAPSNGRRAKTHASAGPPALSAEGRSSDPPPPPAKPSPAPTRAAKPSPPPSTHAAKPSSASTHASEPSPASTHRAKPSPVSTQTAKSSPVSTQTAKSSPVSTQAAKPSSPSTHVTKPSPATIPDAAAPPSRGAGKGRGRLKDMLGFAHLATATGGGEPAPRPAPALSLVPKPADSEAPGEAGAASPSVEIPGSNVSAELAELAALRAELETLGVPDARQMPLGRALEAVARGLERGELTWTVLRAATALVMEHPALAARAMPLLVTCFDRAA